MDLRGWQIREAGERLYLYTYSNKYMEMIFRDKSQRDQIHALLSGAVVQ